MKYTKHCRGRDTGEASQTSLPVKHAEVQDCITVPENNQDTNMKDTKSSIIKYFGSECVLDLPSGNGL